MSFNGYLHGAPYLHIQYTLPTVTPTPTYTPTLIPTITLTPSRTLTPRATVPSSFSRATFIYDGDGKRVKSTINGTITTYFVGEHYEVANGVVTKYYYAGKERIAMRSNSALSYLLGDHLGSTSLTTSATGTVISESRYKAWGEVRYASGNTATKYAYTGQYSYTSEFGLLFYNARWYDPTLGRFNQPDTIIPGQSQGVQAWDRFAYSNNNPVKYVDPSGHCIDGISTIVCIAVAGALIGGIVDAAIQYHNTGNIDWGEVGTAALAGSAIAVTAAVAAPALIGMAGEALMGAGAATGSASVFSAGVTTYEAGSALATTLFGASAAANQLATQCSFNSDTYVETKDGEKLIGEIQIGDYVLAWNESDNTINYYPIKAVLVHEDKTLTELILNGEWIETTPEHPFYTEESGWLPADELKLGMHIRQADGDYELVWLKWNIHKTQHMYNLTVDTAHTFFVGRGKWLVHNDCEKEIKIANRLQKVVGNTGTGKPTIALSSNGILTHSGWSTRPKFTQGTGQAMSLAQNMGFTFESHNYDPEGAPGLYYASHAEAQMAALAPGKPIGVSNMMCANCQDFYSRLAQYRAEIQVVADPYVTRIFYPDGGISVVR
jgi:RHS repeat-associated protein